MRPFDAARAEFPTRVLPCADVVDLIPLSHAPERMACIANGWNRAIDSRRFR